MTVVSISGNLTLILPATIACVLFGWLGRTCLGANLLHGQLGGLSIPLEENRWSNGHTKDTLFNESKLEGSEGDSLISSTNPIAGFIGMNVGLNLDILDSGSDFDSSDVGDGNSINDETHGDANCSVNPSHYKCLIQSMYSGQSGNGAMGFAEFRSQPRHNGTFQKRYERICVQNEGLIKYGEEVDDLIMGENMTSASFVENEVCWGSALEKTICFVNDCDKSHIRCQVHGTCCEKGRGDNFNTTINRKGQISDDFNRFESVDASVSDDLPVVRFWGGSGSVCRDIGDFAYLMVRKCRGDFSNHETRTLCEKEVPVDRVALDVIVPVTERDTGVVFYNKYCAQCNDAKNVLPWEVRWECQTYVFVLGALNQSDLFNKVRETGRNQSTCEMRQESPLSDVALCDPRFYIDEMYVVSTCMNETMETSYSPVIEEECLNRPMELRQRVVSCDKTYKNVYCLLCNRHRSRISSSNVQPPFSVLFGLNEDRHVDGFTSPECNGQGEWADPQGNCSKVMCTEGKVLKADGCETALDEIRGLPYRIDVWLLPAAIDQHTVTSQSDLDLDRYAWTLNSELRDLLDQVSDPVMELTVGVTFTGHHDSSSFFGMEEMTKHTSNRSNWGLKPTDPSERPNSKQNQGALLADADTFHQRDDNVDSVKHNPRENTNRVEGKAKNESFLLAWVEAYVKADKSIPRDEFEAAILDTFHSKNIIIQNKSMNLKAVFTPQVMYNSTSATDIFQSCNNFSKESPCVISSFSSNSTYSSPARHYYIKWRSSLTCPHIDIPRKQVTFTVFNDFVSSLLRSVTINFGKTTVQLTEPFELNQVSWIKRKEGFISVCRGLLDSKIEFNSSGSFDVNIFVMYILNVICLGVSLVCLFLTVMTYFLLPSLRCVAGCNTLGLSSSLLVAQLTILVTGNFPVSWNIPDPLCIAIGMAIHYSWMSFITWSFLCCLHMLQVFTASVRSAHPDKRSERRMKIRNLTLSLLIPALVVSIVIVTSYLMHDGKQIGYGLGPSGSCTFLSPLTIMVPILVVVFVNAIFFIVVVVKIRAVRSLQSNGDFRKEDRSDILIFVKLSTLTGTTYVLLMLGEYLDTDFLRYPAIVINGCQGVFLFSSFVLNRRVLGMYAQRFVCLSFLERRKQTFVSGQTKSLKTKTTDVDTSNLATKNCEVVKVNSV